MSDFREAEEEEEEEAEAEVAAKAWRIAEEATQEIIEKVQPTALSELRRKSVIDYVHSLITRSTASQVFPFGSVPLKTYLPDGDIDLTAVCGKNVVEEQLAYEVYSALEREDHNSAAEFVVKDIQLIRAEVKLVKCLVQNIVVDISFNQLGGLSTLCFLEKVDLRIGKDHLFKRSIILIKAWCYYESRILGAHHGLISTYALETLVLYIFHVFHSSLNGPLAALYKFLDYFSKFDWDNYCISLNGPVRLVSLPELIVETPENGSYDPLLSDEFFKECMEMFSVPARGYNVNSRLFCPKHLNIVDPLKENNNLGRSVSKGNFYRIKSAFTHGARKLGVILSLPEESVANELRKFFSNTLDRHGSGERPDVQDSIPIDHQFESVAALTFSCRELNQQDQILCESETAILRGRSGESAGLAAKKSGKVSNFVRMETNDSANRVAVYETCLNGHAMEPGTFGIQGLSISNDNFDSRASSIEPSKSPRVKELNVPSFYFSRSTVEDGEGGNGNAQWGRPSRSCFAETRLSCGVLLAAGEEMTPVECTDVDSSQLLADNEFLSHCESKKHPLYLNSSVQSFKDVYPGYYGSYALITAAGIPEPLYTLADLTGDYDNHLRNLHYGRSCYEHSPRAPVHSMSQAFTEQSQVQNYWDVIGQPMHIKEDVIPPLNSNVLQSSQLYSYRRHLLPGTALVADEMTKPRGTGTYFPNMNHYLDRVSTTRGRNQGPLRSPRGNGRITASQETTLPERNGCELLQTQVPYQRNGRKAGSFNHRQYRSPEAKSNSHVNGTVHLSERVVEFGSLGQVPPGTTVSVESVKQPKIGYVPAQNSSVSLSTWGSQRSKPVSSLQQDRIDGQLYKLKDDEDFPPLCDSDGQSFKLKDDEDFPPLCDSNVKGLSVRLCSQK